MITLNGKYTNATIMTDNVEQYAIVQIQNLIDFEAFENQQSSVVVMPDVHPGKVGPIGLTFSFKDKVMPAIVGSDIGCGMTMVRLKNFKPNYQQLDTVIRENIPSGLHSRGDNKFSAEEYTKQLVCSRFIDKGRANRSLCTLGSGNHFIEIDKDKDGNHYLIVHSGSRYLGGAVCKHYMDKAHEELKSRGLDIPYEMSYVDSYLFHGYTHDANIVADYATQNRGLIIDVICKKMKWKFDKSEIIECRHNFIEPFFGNYIARKGAIPANRNDVCIIPINMRDGIILAYGYEDMPEWNWSAPHGAGRIIKRSEVAEAHTTSEFKKEMKAAGVYTTCISKDTLDEAPFAYRRLEEIQHAIGENFIIDEVLKPVYNFKAGRD